MESIEPRLIFVVQDHETGPALHNDLYLCSYLVDTYKPHAFIGECFWAMSEIMWPKLPEVLLSLNQTILSRCDAVYAHEGFHATPIVDLSHEMGLPVLNDPMDLELFINTPVQ